MSKYILIYNGKASDLSEMSDEDKQQVLSGWEKWMGSVGNSLKDVGSPFSAGVSIVDNGDIKDSLPLSGYSIIEANSLEEAKKMCVGHPFLSEGLGNFSIELFELAPAPF